MSSDHIAEEGRAAAVVPRIPRDAAISALAGLAVFLVAGAAEMAAVRLLRIDPQELDWVSDAILAAAFASAVFLWMRLKESRSEMSRLEREHLVLDTQLAVAADIQRRILPAAPARAGGCRWAARLRPAGRVGGDYYDFIECGPDSVLAVVADISGKGIPAALLLSSTRVLLRSIARQTRDPGEILTRLSAATYAEYEGMPYVTCIAARFDGGATRRVTYANAGHPPGLVARGEGVQRLDSGGPPVGLFADARYTSAVVELEAAAAGVIVTDGITDAIEASGRVPMEVLISLLARREPASTAESVCDEIMREADRGARDGIQDDRTVVVFAIEAAGA